MLYLCSFSAKALEAQLLVFFSQCCRPLNVWNFIVPFSLDNQSHLQSFHAKKKELRPESEEDHYLLLVEGGVLLTCVYRILCTQHPPPPSQEKRHFFQPHTTKKSCPSQKICKYYQSKLNCNRHFPSIR